MLKTEAVYIEALIKANTKQVTGIMEKLGRVM